MAVAVGGGPDLLKVCNPNGFEALKQLADRWGLPTILSAVQLLDEALVRMRVSVQSQALFEVALDPDLATPRSGNHRQNYRSCAAGRPLARGRAAIGCGTCGIDHRLLRPQLHRPRQHRHRQRKKKNAEGLDLSSLRADQVVNASVECCRIND